MAFDLLIGVPASAWSISLVLLDCVGVIIAFLSSLLAVRLIAKRDVVGGCEACGYDLQGNESGTCPECGEAVKATQ